MLHLEMDHVICHVFMLCHVMVVMWCHVHVHVYVRSACAICMLMTYAHILLVTNQHACTSYRTL